MTLSKQQIEHEKLRFQKWFWIWERDLLQMAREYPAWRDKAHSLGFQDAKIDAEWTHADEGAQLKYMQNPWFKGD
jgi:hypothetical protein